ncbi:thioredoxin family protein [Clostridiaceae bacterium HSG29]|nr:thioredoxin family protein [Clostridiaceae bacterium HSG29]
MNIKILGTGCSKCNKLYDLVTEVVKSENLDVNIEKVQDMKTILSYKIMALPGLVIDEEVIFAGSIPSKKKLIKILSK